MIHCIPYLRLVVVFGCWVFGVGGELFRYDRAMFGMYIGRIIVDRMEWVYVHIYYNCEEIESFSRDRVRWA